MSTYGKFGKLPPDKVSKGEIQLKYGPFLRGEQFGCGSMELRYESPASPDKVFHQIVSATGSYQTRETDSQQNEIFTNMFSGTTKTYTVKNQSTQVDGHKDDNTESTSRTNVMGDRGVSFKTGYEVATQGVIKARAEFSKIFTLGTRSESKSFVGSDGDHAEEHTGNWHEAFEKDHVQAVKGNKISMVEEGDYAIHVQQGNFDTHIKEKGRIYADNDILMESKTKITLKVGGSTIVLDPSSITLTIGGSKIEMTSGNIKATSPRIDLN